MKKTYVKPEIMLVRFELSEAIASCDTLLFTNHEYNSCVLNPNLEGIFPGINATTDISCSKPLKDYCYFTSSKGILMNS